MSSLFLMIINSGANAKTSLVDEDLSIQQESALIRSHTTSIDIYKLEQISVQESFVVENTEASNMSYIDLWFNTSLSTLIVEDGEGSMNYNWYVITNSSNSIRVNFRTELEQNDTASFTVKYDLNTFLTPIGEDPSYYSFEFYSTISYLTNSYKMVIYLPERSFMHEFTDSTPSIYPINSTQVLEKNRIKTTWVLDNLAPESNPFFLIRFDEPIVPEELLTFWEKGSTMFLIGFIVGIFIGISGISWLIRYREKKAMKKIGMTLLTDNQKTLIKIIYDKRGKVSQKELCDITGYSKSKISRNLVPLELRGLIKREKWGRTYVIYLTDDGRTVIE
ncbi:MAG: helix-turn-helix transcriptional regulator [Candidatus Heimdallarchaeaceae archaeon]